MKNIVFIALLVGMAVSLSACYTVRGVGQDVAATGHAVQRAATPGPHYH